MSQTNIHTSGYAEIAYSNQPNQLKEFRAEYAVGYASKDLSVSLCAEVFLDKPTDETTPDWCELYIRYENEYVGVTLGRQTLNWGLGQYFYVNDPFAKDWQSPAIGRDKGDIDDVNDGIHLTVNKLFATSIQFDWVWAKFFIANTYADAGRINLTAQQDVQLSADMPNKSEHMLRISQQATGLNWALFYHQGYQKQPQLLDDIYQFNKLKHFGISISTQLALGEVGLELGHSQIEQAGDLNKYLVVFTPKFFSEADKNFLRLQWLKDNSSNWLGVELQHAIKPGQSFALAQFFSTEKMSAMLMAHYNLTFYQMWTWELGVNLFKGDDVGAQWDYFAESSNLYTRLRFNF